MIQKAKSLNPPCKIGLIAPASAPRDEQRLSDGVAALHNAGFDVIIKRESFAPMGYLAGSDDVRLDELNGFLQDDQVNALICVRGGYGTLRILGQVDYEAARAHPKLLVGYSDITALQLALFKHAGWISVSGPMASIEWPEPDSLDCLHFLDLVSSSYEPGPIDPEGPGLTTLVAGDAEGRLLGGNLSLITRLIGTDFLPDMNGAILFLEEIGESPYRVDGLLAHLQLAGILDSLAGIVLGGFTDAEPDEGKPSLSLNEVFDDYFGDLGIPVATGLRYGHFPTKIAVPIGVRANLAASDHSAVLSILESPTENS